MAQTTLVIRHLERTEPPQFQVERASDGKRGEATVVPSPVGYPVEGRPSSDLLEELRWYLEDFLQYPFPPETEHAERVLGALSEWGKEAFEAVFKGRRAAQWLGAATEGNYSNLTLRIQSDDPRILAWPWEALRDPETGLPLAHTCRVERRLNNVPDPRPLPETLPRDRINILLVVARPYGDREVRFRSVARLLINLIEERKLPAKVNLLRPPTFKQLDDHLKAYPGHYHILHFDGHGSYGNGGDGGRYRFQGPEGQLIFETKQGNPDPVTAEKLNALLSEHAVPGVVLNACQSAMLSQDAKDPFASVAASLVRAGTRSVAAMAYTLYVSGAQKFLPAFYQRLFTEGDFAEAVRAGRRAMIIEDKRICARGEFPLQDWLLPVTYQQEPIDFSFASQVRFKPRDSKLSREIGEGLRRSGFIGRDQAVLDLERAMRRDPAGILIEGMGGVGKTTLARGFLDWLDKTNGLGEGTFWFGFEEIRTADYVLNRLGEAFFDAQFATETMEQRINALTDVLGENQFVIVWDNLESASGVEGTSVTANLSEEDRGSLRRFLEKLRGGKSKVLITSRSPEQWLSHEDCYRLPLGGLDGEERWEFCQAILDDLGLAIDRQDPDQVKLMDFLRGHPLAMRMVLPKLAEMPAGQVVEALRSNVSSLGIDEIDATVRFIEEGLPAELRPLLVPLGLHERFVDSSCMEEMAKRVGGEWTREDIDRLFGTLRIGGLLYELRQGIWAVHPVLSGYLRSMAPRENAGHAVGEPSQDTWAQAFVVTMGRLADAYAPKELHEQRDVFHFHGPNFHLALSEAERLGMEPYDVALTQSLAFYTLNTRDFVSAARLFESQAKYGQKRGNKDAEAAAYHQMGMVARIQRDFSSAEKWCEKSLRISENLGNENRAAGTYQQLGMIAEEQRDFPAAQKQYQKSLAIFEKLDDEESAATIYHQLGIIAQEQEDFGTAEKWYRRALAIKEKMGNDYTAADTYHQLGIITQRQRDFPAAQKWYQKSLVIDEKVGNQYGTAATYQQLGMIAQEQQDFVTAETLYRRSLAIFEKLGDEHRAALTYGQLGLSACLQGDFELSGRWLIKSRKAFLRTKDHRLAEQSSVDFMVSYRNATPAEHARLRALWQEAELGNFPEQASAAGE